MYIPLWCIAIVIVGMIFVWLWNVAVTWDNFLRSFDTDLYPFLSEQAALLRLGEDRHKVAQNLDDFVTKLRSVTDKAERLSVVRPAKIGESQ